MKDNSFIIKGDIIYSKDRDKLASFKDAYIVCDNGISGGVYERSEDIPEKYRDLRIVDHSGKLVIPGMTDLHLHAPQYGFRGLWGDMELLDWLNIHTFPEESKYADPEYAMEAYKIFINDMKSGATARFCAFSKINFCCFAFCSSACRYCLFSAKTSAAGVSTRCAAGAPLS